MQQLFLSFFFLQLWWPILSPVFHRFVYLCIDVGIHKRLRQLPQVRRAFGSDCALLWFCLLLNWSVILEYIPDHTFTNLAYTYFMSEIYWTFLPHFISIFFPELVNFIVLLYNFISLSDVFILHYLYNLFAHFDCILFVYDVLHNNDSHKHIWNLILILIYYNWESYVMHSNYWFKHIWNLILMWFTNNGESLTTDKTRRQQTQHDKTCGCRGVHTNHRMVSIVFLIMNLFSFAVKTKTWLIKSW